MNPMSILFRFLGPLFACLFLVGCYSNGPVKVGLPADPDKASQGVHGLWTVGGLYTGSGIQWNEEYYVTARHVKMLSRPSHTCNCDLKFIKRPFSGDLPRWREARPGEEIVALGYNSKVPLFSRGRVLGLPIIVENPYAAKGKELRILSTISPWPNFIAYQTHDAPIMGGMSGGAVISVETGEVLGMNISFTKKRRQRLFNQEHGLAPDTPVSIFVPYSMIQASWDNYQRMKQGQLRWQLPGQDMLRR